MATTNNEPNLLSLDDKRALVWSAQDMPNDVALSVTLSDFERYRRWRYENHDVRWNTNDALYVGWMPQRFWEGTRTPRASVGVFMCLEQIEAALPVIMNALFADAEWFEVDPILGSTVQQAQQIKERLLYLLENPPSRFGHTVRNEVRLAVKQYLTYGNGMMSVEPDGQGNPRWSWTDIKDVYVDPGAPTPCIDDATAGIHRDWLSLDDIESMRDTEGISLPPALLLRELANARPSDSSDDTKRNQLSLFGVNWSPGVDDWTDFVPDKKLEVLRRVSADRIVWILQRRWVMYNQRNPYGFINYASAPCYIVPGRFYAMGIPDVLEGNQKYSQAILNAHLDELSLTLNPPRVQKRNITLPFGDQSIRPGMRWASDNPREDMMFHPPSGMTQNGWQEFAFFGQNSQQLTGISNMISSGMPIRSNASRSATGISAQATGPTTRLQYMVETLEDYLIVPLLYKTMAMDAYLNGASENLPGVDASGQSVRVDPSSLKASVKFRLKGSTRMLTQQKLQFIAPFLAQYYLNGAFMSQLAKSGQTIDYAEFDRLIQDAVGTRAAYRLVRPMTEQEKAAMQQPSPDSQLRAKQSADSNDVRREIAQLKAQGEQSALANEASMNEEKIAAELLKLLSGASGRGSATEGSSNERGTDAA